MRTTQNLERKILSHIKKAVENKLKVSQHSSQLKRLEMDVQPSPRIKASRQAAGILKEAKYFIFGNTFFDSIPGVK